MREIKFRGYRNKKLIYNLQDYCCTKSNCEHADCDGSLREYIERGEHIMQCSGLKDQSGEYIWEGDIITCRCEEFEGIGTGIVEYRPEFAGYCFTSRSKNNKSIFPLHNFFEITIIGNIYENPELLEVDK